MMKKIILLFGIFFISNFNLSSQGLPPDGEFISYHSNGVTFLTGEVKNNKKHGVWEFFYDNGELQAREKYNEGIPTGIWKTFSSNGRLMQKKDFRNIGSLPPTSRGNPYSSKGKTR
jgi:antitoxin component YwqK of YwqJK toxin-antitoxin module